MRIFHVYIITILVVIANSAFSDVKLDSNGDLKTLNGDKYETLCNVKSQLDESGILTIPYFDYSIDSFKSDNNDKWLVFKGGSPKTGFDLWVIDVQNCIIKKKIDLYNASRYEFSPDNKYFILTLNKYLKDNSGDFIYEDNSPVLKKETKIYDGNNFELLSQIDDIGLNINGFYFFGKSGEEFYNIDYSCTKESGSLVFEEVHYTKGEVTTKKIYLSDYYPELAEEIMYLGRTEGDLLHIITAFKNKNICARILFFDIKNRKRIAQYIIDTPEAAQKLEIIYQKHYREKNARSFEKEIQQEMPTVAKEFLYSSGGNKIYVRQAKEILKKKVYFYREIDNSGDEIRTRDIDIRELIRNYNGEELIFEKVRNGIITIVISPDQGKKEARKIFIDIENMVEIENN